MIQIQKNYGTPTKPKTYGYGCVRYKKGWADIGKYLPAEYDLVTLKIGDKHIPGWYAAGRWEGIRLKRTDVVTHWRKDE